MNDKLGVIFDMDGVLVDSYDAHFQSWQRVAEEERQTFTKQQFAATFGQTSREIIASLWDGSLTEERIRDLDNRKEAAYRQIIEANFPAMHGAGELLRRLKDAGFSLAVGSSGPPENIDVVLDQLQARSLFSAVVSGADVTRGKPDPQVFLIAAERLGLAPAECVVVEDAPLGITAAHAAGAPAIGFASTGRTRKSLAEAELVVDSLDEISPDVVRGLAARRN